MSKDLADRFDRDLSASDETISQFDELMNRSTAVTPTNQKERLDAEIDNTFVAAEVDSWDDLWQHYRTTYPVSQSLESSDN